jgi:hypothetical protein
VEVTAATTLERVLVRVMWVVLVRVVTTGLPLVGYGASVVVATARRGRRRAAVMEVNFIVMDWGSKDQLRS